MARRAFVIVLDAAGAGALPDTVAYGDPSDADTLVHVAEAVGGMELPALQALGLGCIRPIAGVPCSAGPVLHGRLAPQGPGKESTTGHWELMGVVTPAPLPVYRAASGRTSSTASTRSRAAPASAATRRTPASTSCATSARIICARGS
jgi:phosphopentomutase